MDVTAAKEAEDRIRLIINAVPALIWTAQADGRLDFISQRWLDYVGINIRTIGSGELGERTVHPDDIEQLRDKWRVAVAEGNPFEAEIRVRRFDGEYRWFLSRASPLRDRAGHILGWYGNDIDIEDRKRAEEALRRSERYLAEAQRLTHTGSWVWRVAGREALHLSEEWYRIWGFDREAVVPTWQERLERIYPEDRDRWQATIERAISEKSDYELEFRILLLDGTVRYLHTVGHPVVIPSGDVVQFVGSSIDITERTRAEALRDGESRILEMIARDAPLKDILENLVLVVEAQFAGLLCSVLLLDDDGQHIRHGAAPSLPKPYTDAIDGLCIGPTSRDHAAPPCTADNRSWLVTFFRIRSGKRTAVWLRLMDCAPAGPLPSFRIRARRWARLRCTTANRAVRARLRAAPWKRRPISPALPLNAS